MIRIAHVVFAMLALFEMCRISSFQDAKVSLFVEGSFFRSVLWHGIVTQKDRDFMQRALQLAKQAKRKTFPNPCVGCILVSENDTVIGEGFHEQAGQGHAEVNALRDLERRGQGGGIPLAENATAYVTLEPCNHYGRTPPCTLALIRNGVKRVVVGMVDPDSRVAGKGLKTLQSHGIEVDLVGGEEEKAAAELNLPYIYRVIHNRTFCAVLELPLTQSSPSDQILESLIKEVDLLDSVVIDSTVLRLNIYHHMLSKLLPLFSNVFLLHTNHDLHVLEALNTLKDIVHVVVDPKVALSIEVPPSTSATSKLFLRRICSSIVPDGLTTKKKELIVSSSMSPRKAAAQYLREVCGSNGVLFIESEQSHIGPQNVADIQLLLRIEQAQVRTTRFFPS